MLDVILPCFRIEMEGKIESEWNKKDFYVLIKGEPWEQFTCYFNKKKVKFNVESERENLFFNSFLSQFSLEIRKISTSNGLDYY